MVAPRVDPDEEELQALCSLCYEPVPVPQVYILPHFNDILNNYVTTYRCAKCAPVSLNETRDRLLATTERWELDSCAEFFERYNLFVLEHKRGDKNNALRAVLLELVERIRTRDLQLDIGKAVPIKLPDFLKPPDAE